MRVSRQMSILLLIENRRSGTELSIERQTKRPHAGAERPDSAHRHDGHADGADCGTGGQRHLVAGVHPLVALFYAEWPPNPQLPTAWSVAGSRSRITTERVIQNERGSGNKPARLIARVIQRTIEAKGLIDLLKAAGCVQSHAVDDHRRRPDGPFDELAGDVDLLHRRAVDVPVDPQICQDRPCLGEVRGLIGTHRMWQVEDDLEERSNVPR